MTKHTQGPWRIGTPPPYGEQTIGNHSGMMVAVATTGIGMGQETLANARLIAAAPELLEALDDVLSICDPKNIQELAIGASARNLIERIKGEQNA